MGLFRRALPALLVALALAGVALAQPQLGLRPGGSLTPTRIIGPNVPAVVLSTTTIPFASVRTLNATPVTVVSAPGAGKYIEVVSIQVMLDYGSAAYDSIGSEPLTFKYTNASGAKVSDDITASGFAGATADAYRVVRGISVTPVGNAAVVAHIETGEWYSAAGNSPLKVAVLYRVRTLDL